ncbi:MAG: UDP-N-acetylmuramoyl-L-alanine--D-glutamate ligase [Bacteroidetes bacterium]|nr:UDP-N-acetylmuramoyl-L-alanine--D-glutamate ligase [Bacteroidota bacterium]|tara:strand:+ start:1685 stop:3031 length:1347 start_codon:yes stop_codon:yes gene_type:complete
MITHYQIVILGGGESGVGAALLAKKKGISVFISDNNKLKQKYINVLKHSEIDFEEGGHTENLILSADEIVKSPGIPETVAIIESIRAKKIPIISEIEFAARYTSAKLICITGSNGKTTTSLLLYHILKAGGTNVGLAGNIGDSFAKQVAENDYDVYVLEISSFQLDGIVTLRANIAIILNITPDHLDRYNNNFSNYIDSKFRIIQNQTTEDALIYCFDDPAITEKLKHAKVLAQQFPISLSKREFNQGAYLNKNEIIIVENKTQIHMTLEQLALQGKHNIYNTMAAGVASRLLEIRRETLKTCLSDFHNVAHRLEFVSSVHGISFINDSKAANVNSAWYALEHYDKPIIWIAGGLDKGNDYGLLVPLAKNKVKAIVCLGLNNEPIHDAFGDIVEIILDTYSAIQAVNAAYNIAKKGDVVLLSPACASMDLFENYEDRGNQFKSAVKEL